MSYLRQGEPNTTECALIMSSGMKIGEPGQPSGDALLGYNCAVTIRLKEHSPAMTISRERVGILDLLRRKPGLRPAEIAAALERQPGAVRRLLYSMTRDGEIHQEYRGDGYTIAGPPVVAERMLTWLEGRSEHGMMDDCARWFLDECEERLRKLMAESERAR